MELGYAILISLLAMAVVSCDTHENYYEIRTYISDVDTLYLVVPENSEKRDSPRFYYTDNQQFSIYGNAKKYRDSLNVIRKKELEVEYHLK